MLQRLIFEVEEALKSKINNKPLTTKLYRRVNRYQILKVGEKKKLILQNKEAKDDSYQFFCKEDELFDILDQAHISSQYKRTRGLFVCFFVFFSTLTGIN